MSKIYSQDAVLKDIQDVAKRLSKNSLSSREYLEHGCYSHGYIRKEFGSILQAFKAAGLATRERFVHNRIDDQSLILEDIQRVAKQLNTQALSQEHYFQYGRFSDGPLRRLFGSVSNAFQRAGLERYKPILPSDIIADMQRVAKHGQLSSTQYQQSGQYSLSTIRYTFGTFTHARQVAGLVRTQRPDAYTQDVLKSHLKRYYRQFHNVPSKRDISQTAGYLCDKTFYATFPGNSWAQILSTVGLLSSNQILGLDGNYYDSHEEKSIADFLYRNYISYESHKRVCLSRKWTCDFYLPDRDVWVEYDGLGVHRKNKDSFQEKIQYYQDNHYNFIVLGTDDNIVKSLMLTLKYRKSDLVIDYMTNHEVQPFLDRVHYLGRRHDKYYIGCYLNNQLCGVATFGHNTNPHEKYLCLNRFATLDIMDKNFGSYFMSKALRRLKQIGYRGKIVSWSDPRHHTGSLYRACNFTPIKTKSKKDYIYVDKDTGEEYHKSRCRVPAGQSELEYAKLLGLIKIIIPSKQRWEIEI